MSLTWNLVAENRLLLSPSPWPPAIAILNRTSTQLTCHRVWRRRRLKRSSYVVVRNQLSSPSSSSQPPLENLFRVLISQLNSLDLLAPALGFATALAVYNSRTTSTSDHNQLSDFIGDWTLFTSPTPFNRFVTLRCASLLLEDAEEKLVKEDGHLVRLNRGKIQQIDVNYADDVLGKELVYQRICVNTADGGVISLDWPANLEFTEEHCLDTTILIVPGTADGSMDDDIRLFVCKCLMHGCFPIVMNPRGCARSPLTTPRLFTAADSDDICTTVQFINRARPWTTLMGAGWGYGANMLTKYLSEVGDKTPLTAASCIDNPFDLYGAAGSSPYLNFGHHLTGLIDVLQSNKELFRGRPKGFDVEKALQATSILDFEEAISMVSYGFDSIEDFYAKSGTRDVVGNVKIPLLFIQNTYDAVPLFSIPRSLIAENPFTSLIVCSCPAYDKITTRTSAASWCQHLVIEWLTAIELGLLKGRHPLLEDNDVAINPSKRLRLMENRASHTVNRIGNPLDFHQLEGSNGHPSYPLGMMLKRKNASSSGHCSQKDSESEDQESKKDNNGVVKQTNLVDTELLKEREVNSIDHEKGQLLQTTEVVMNMLDVAMPETLSEEQKKKVLTAVGQGETIMNALRDAVPEDVRGKLTSSVAEILQKQKLNLNGLPSISQIHYVPSGLNAKMREKGALSSPDKTPFASDQNKANISFTEGSDDQPGKIDTSGGGVAPDVHTSGNLGKSSENSQSGNPSDDASKSINTSHEELLSSNESSEFSKEDAAFSSQLHKSVSTGKPEASSRLERDSSREDQISERVKVGQEVPTPFSDRKEESDNQQNEEKDAQNSIDEKKMSTSRTEEILKLSTSSSENQSMEKEGSENQEKEESSAQPIPNQSSSNIPTFSVSQAFDALTGIDDSTQVAVNSVFSVLEDMITQLEVNRDNGSLVSEKNKIEDDATDSESEHSNIDFDLQQKEDGKSNVSLESYDSGNHELHLSISKISAEKNGEVRISDDSSIDVPDGISKLPYGDILHDQYLRNYLISKMKNEESHDRDSTTALFLDYIPEEGQWKLLEQSGDGKSSLDESMVHEGIDKNVQSPMPDSECTSSIIEPAYVILDAENDWDIVEAHEKQNEIKEKELGTGDDASGVLMQLVKKNISDSLKVELRRRVRATFMEPIAPMLAKELEHVADAISFAVVHGKEHKTLWDCAELARAGTLQAEHIIEAISSAVQSTRYMKRVIPVGIIVGSSLASLRKFFNNAAADAGEAMTYRTENSHKGYHIQTDRTTDDPMPLDDINQKNNLYHANDGYEENKVSRSLKSDTVMVGAVTAAIGASALLVQQDSRNVGDGTSRTSSASFNEKESQQESGKLDEEMSERSDHNVVKSLAEKAMSVAGPVVPTKEDGEVDQDRLVAMLADLGQKGGILKLVGKVALLWGGIRGAMSLTDRLIFFLRIAERPLFQRILGFVCMVLVLWTPVAVPLLPTLVQNWAAHKSSKIAELACIIGLYASIMILVVLWGKRIRGYGDPLERYGLELILGRQIRNFLGGLIGGVMLVSLIQSLNVLLGFVCISWPTAPSSTDAVTLFKLYGKVLGFVGQALVTAIAVSLVEELLFRSWLPDEIASDLGYNRGIILSGLAFSLSQRSLGAMPGLWLLSLGLAGARQRSQGSLSLAIGLRAGIMASSFVLKVGGFLTYQPNFPLWVSGGNPFQPFSGLVGFAVALLWAVIFYPREPQHTKKLTRKIKE